MILDYCWIICGQLFLMFRRSDRSSILLVHRSSSSLKKPTFGCYSLFHCGVWLLAVLLFSIFSLFATLNPPKNVSNITSASVFLLFGPRPSFFRLWTSFWSLFRPFWAPFGLPLGEPRTRFCLFFLTWAAQGSPGEPRDSPNGPKWSHGLKKSSFWSPK